MRCMLLIFSGKKTGGSCLEKLLQLISACCLLSSLRMLFPLTKVEVETAPFLRVLEAADTLFPIFHRANLLLNSKASFRWTLGLNSHIFFKRGKPIDMFSIVGSVMCNT